jgi:hypothetical protein
MRLHFLFPTYKHPLTNLKKVKEVFLRLTFLYLLLAFLFVFSLRNVTITCAHTHLQKIEENTGKCLNMYDNVLCGMYYNSLFFLFSFVPCSLSLSLSLSLFLSFSLFLTHSLSLSLSLYSLLFINMFLRRLTRVAMIFWQVFALRIGNFNHVGALQEIKRKMYQFFVILSMIRSEKLRYFMFGNLRTVT